MTRRKTYRRRQASSKELLFILPIIAAGVLAAYFSANLSDYGYALFMLTLTSIAIILGFVGVAVYFVMKKNARELQLMQALDIAQIDTMSGVAFENYISLILRSQGYKVRTTPVSGDFGVDLIIEKDKIKTAVQIKRYQKSLNQSAIREVVAGRAMKHYNASETMVVTNSRFTDSAKQLALANNCMLIDRNDLAEWILAFQNQV